MKAPRRPARSPQQASLIEQLESRQLLAGIGLSGGVLTVAGSARADNLRVAISGNQVVVHLNRATKTFSKNGIDQLKVLAGSGNDKVNVTGKLDSIIIDGGPGNDNIRGSGGGDLITGGAGDDFVSARGGDDQVYGDAGDDVLHGGNGNDTLGGDDEDLLTPIASEVGNDDLFGDAGDDWLLMGQDSDQDIRPDLQGIQPGITDPSGNDNLSGGSGNDVTDIRGRNDDGLETGSNGTIIDETENNIVPVRDVAGVNQAEEDLVHHKHAFIKLRINGQDITLPNGAGTFFGQPVAHTHEAPTPLDVRGNLIHLHNTATSGGANRVFTLGDFFQHWGISFSKNNIGRFRVDKHHTLTMIVKPKGGAVVSFSDAQSFNHYVIQSSDSTADDAQTYDQISIEYKTV